jgi:predicted transcriptional regulator
MSDTVVLLESILSEAFSIRLPDEQKAFLEKLAEATDRSRNSIISTAVGRMMDSYQFVLDKVEQGDADVAAGRIVSMGDVEKRTQSIIDRAMQKKAG